MKQTTKKNSTSPSTLNEEKNNGIIGMDNEPRSARKRSCCSSLCRCCSSLCRCCFLFIGIPCLIVIVKIAVDHQYHPKISCVGWEGSGSCEVCNSSIGMFVSDALHVPADLGAAAQRVAARLLKPDLRATCHKCPPGWALVKGSPVVNHVFSSPNGTEFVWDTHCAEMLHETEKQVLMIRHGQSTWNAYLEKNTEVVNPFGLLFIGADAPLTKLGLNQARRLANILRKADDEVYGSATASKKAKLPAELSGARSELKDAFLEEEVEITERATKRLVTDSEMVGNLASMANRVELDVLVGRKCKDTNFVSSALTRAMDTLLIGTMERNLRCHSPWQISSNLQELEHNMDCDPKLQPGGIPKFVEMQQEEYSVAGINDTKEFVESMYPQVDSSRHLYNKKKWERLRLWDHSPQMIAELDATFASPKKFSVWGGHSIWFRMFFQYFADRGNKACEELASMKMANTAIISVHIRRLANSPRKYVAYRCKFIHLGSHEVFKIGKNKNSTEKTEEKKTKEKSEEM